MPDPTSALTAPSREDRWALAVGLAAALVGLARAAALHWVCDDAFISFRYAQHLVEGNGLVWNVGERVEGITNLGWTLALAAAARAGADLSLAAQVLGGLSYAALLALTLAFELTVDGAGARRWPVATVLLALVPDLQVWATGGLETMTVALLPVVLAAAWWKGRPGVAGAVGVALWLLRPDAVLLCGGLGLAWVGSAPGPRRWVVAAWGLGLPGLAVALTTAWRLRTYGLPVPNTFYAKSADVAWWDQGGWYVAHFAVSNPALVLALLAGGVVAVRERGRAAPMPRHLAAAMLATAALFTLYVVRSGGDFMQARRLVPAVPLLVLGVRLLAWPALAPRVRAFSAALLAVGAAAALPVTAWWGQGGRWHGVADERAFYPAEVVTLRLAQGRELGAALGAEPSPILIEGGLDMLGFASGLPNLIEPNGLTDVRVAQQQALQRGLPGHEKGLSEQDLDARGVALVVHHAAPPDATAPWVVKLKGTGLYLSMRVYRPNLVAAFERAGARVVNVERLLGRLETLRDAAPCAEVLGWSQFLERYLREVSSARGDAFRAAVALRCPGP